LTKTNEGKTMKIFSTVFLAVILMLGTSLAYANPKQNSITPEQEHMEMLYPTVLVRLERGTGSGTVIYSELNEDQEYESYVLTNNHVIQNYVKVSKIWNSELKEHVETENRRPVNIDLWEYNNFSTAIGTMGRIAEIVAYDKSRDLALLRVKDTERQMSYVATLYPEGLDEGPWIFQTVYAVGAGLGKPPFPTMGLLAGYGRDQDGNELYLSSSPIIFGNSGGSLYVYSPRRTYELIGVPSMVSAYGWGNVVSHMAWSRPIAEIRIFLRENKYGFIIGDDPEPKEEDEKD
jgi:S1-C subfamily serine protease